MVELSSEKIKYYLNLEQSRYQTTKKGNALEDLIWYMLGKVPGVSPIDRNQLDSVNSEAIDLAFQNEKSLDGLSFIDEIIIVECKNWSRPISGMQLYWFLRKLRNRNLKYGVFVARNGIAGNNCNTVGARSVLAEALREGRHIIIITKKELEKITNTDQIVKLFREKCHNLVISVKVN